MGTREIVPQSYAKNLSLFHATGKCHAKYKLKGIVLLELNVCNIKEVPLSVKWSLTEARVI